MVSLFSLIRNGNVTEAIIVLLSRCFVLFFCCPFHEMAHAYAAHKLGDDTAEKQGRLTANPFAHLTPIGSIMILLVGIGYANPVPVNPFRMSKAKNPKQGMAITAFAGPVANVLMGFISVCFYYLFAIISAKSGDTAFLIYIQTFFYYAASVNIMLAVFNLIPIPPLDGSKILSGILPDKVYYKYMQYERYAMIALLVILITGILDRPISWLSNILMTVISLLPHLIYNILT